MIGNILVKQILEKRYTRRKLWSFYIALLFGYQKYLHEIYLQVVL